MAKKPKKKKEEFRGDDGNSANKNDQVTRVGIIIAICILGVVAILMLNRGDNKKGVVDAVEAETRIKGASSRNPSDKESFESLSGQVQGQAGAIDAVTTKINKFGQTIEDMNRNLIEFQQNTKEREEQTENVQIGLLRDELEQLSQKYENLSKSSLNQSSSLPVGGSNDGAGGQDGLVLPPSTRGVVTGDGTFTQIEGSEVDEVREVVVLDLGGDGESTNSILDDIDKDINGNLSDAPEPDVFETQDYVPPNAFAPATVLVGVDAATGQTAQNDPLNATFLITGPASHVVRRGALDTTDLEGCTVNGAAFGHLSSERVFIKLARMTCPLPNGRVSVQEVQGHVTENGKAGVRGQVISRVGDKINRAAIAGLFSGLGASLGNAGRQSIGVGGGGGGLVQDIPNAEELAVASIGSGVSNAANTLTEYYVERARAVEPIVSMPRGIDVELVFITGFKPRPTLESDG